MIDKIEPILLEMDYINPVMQAARGAPSLPYTAAGIDPDSGKWVFIDFGKLPLGNDSPTFLYLIAFPDWHGEQFVKVGIGIFDRVRAHELRGGEVLQKIEVPRWQALIAEKMILNDWPRYRPRVPLPQHGDTECLPWEVANNLAITDYIRFVQTEIRLENR
ncbi:hypothetical protein [Nonomuraea polychroma]|uniref:hypothetical protein n=1 Tax=Nonomuraea polychroma TaxID=46176 RepID=UPI000FDD14B3|nr:hypothetical protein [Nonomuraea polychroma]